ncbi:hypothetical protein CRE_09484 [Caenorhabditis remanei]|uniref:C-type LECtin n=1 Tax=Caenorhabditis remanei TaxID=31234 RepID=E3MJ36_CAERE|nr:hypothetical protein CRE_09484 [Caenorhabditis remanei]
MKLGVFLFFLFSIFYTSFAASTLVCTNGFTLINSKCLKFFPHPGSYATAEASCRSVGATLATVKNANENQAIATFVDRRVDAVWIGLFCFENDLSKCLWDDGTGSAGIYSNFASGFPRVEVGKCVYYSGRGVLMGQWISGDCLGLQKDTQSHVCELPPTMKDDCDYNYNGFCYSLHSPASFVDAQETCEKECGNLVSITSEMENRYVSIIASNGTSSDRAYIGAMWPSPNFLSWIDGSVWSYNKVVPSISRGSANCMVLSTSTSTADPFGFWTNTNCNSVWPFICKRPAGTQCPQNPPVVTVTPVPPTQSFCNAGLLQAPGVFTSPNYPHNYDNNQLSTYQLATLGSYKILLKFTEFITEPMYDIVEVYDGDSPNKPLLGSYSGNLGSFTVNSTGNMLYVRFLSDLGTNFQGFSATFLSYSGP